MKLISMLLALLVVGLVVVKQLNSNSSQEKVNEVLEKEGGDAPKVPVSPKDIPKFEQDINQYVQDKAAERAQDLEKQLEK